MHLSTLANAILAAGLFFALASPALIQPTSRKWVFVVFGIACLDAVVTLLPLIFKPPWIIPGHWNWTGKFLSIGTMLVVTYILVTKASFMWRDFGLTFRQSSASSRSVFAVTAVYLLAILVLTITVTGNTTPPDNETLLYQATMPGFAEELSYRGVMLGLFNRIFTRSVRILGADIGYGPIAVSLAFGLLHGMGFDRQFHLQVSFVTIAVTGTIGFVLAWLKIRTQSLVVPIAVHNITNLVFEGVPKLL
jgi:hypothetical protein